MAFLKKIVTPAGNILGDFGILMAIQTNHLTDGLHAIACLISLYNNEEDAVAGKPPVDNFRYSLGNISYKENDITPIVDKLLLTIDSGVWGQQDQTTRRSTWLPGWNGAMIVYNPSNLGL